MDSIDVLIKLSRLARRYQESGRLPQAEEIVVFLSRKPSWLRIKNSYCRRVVSCQEIASFYHTLLRILHITVA